MTNAEFYKNEIMENRTDFCEKFALPKILGPQNMTCAKSDYVDPCKTIIMKCSQCAMTMMMWLLEEHKEPEVDWASVPIDTPILGRDNEREEWTRGHFAKFKDGRIGVWAYGGTSFTWRSDESDNRSVHYWNHAKLWEGSEEQAEEQEAAE